jgi:radical SAM protein (TIGR01212 family)
MRFPLFKVQKISVDGGFTCPNRDGSKGRGGCIYCNNSSFVPRYAIASSLRPSQSIANQLNDGIRFFSYKYPEMKYIAYFQAYSGTYAPLGTLRKLYEEALETEGVVGLIIGTRPDCVPDETLDYLQELSERTFVMLEYGIESTSNETLRLINRCHTYAEAEDAVRRTAARGIPVGAHVILGLPGESREMMMSHADRLNELPLTSVKLHQLQILRGTALGEAYLRHCRGRSDSGKMIDGNFLDCFTSFAMTGSGAAMTGRGVEMTVDEYIALVREFVARLRGDIYIDRFVSQSPKELVLAPSWGLKNHEFRDKLQKNNYICIF